MKYQGKSVADRVNAITSKNSPSMKLAETQGLQQAGRRGLLNSSMGARAAQAAMIEQAIPMAQTDSQQENEWNMQSRSLDSRKGLLDTELSSREKLHGLDLGQQDRQFNKKLDQSGDQFNREMDQQGNQFNKNFEQSDRQFNQNFEQSGQQFDREMNLKEEDTGYRGQALDLQREEMNQNNKNNQLDRDQRQTLSNMEMAAGERQSAANMLASFESSRAQIISNIMNNTELSKEVRDQEVANANNRFVTMSNLVEQLYVFDVEWAETPPEDPDEVADEPAPEPNRRPTNRYDFNRVN